MKSDLEIAIEFFNMLKTRGFGVLKTDFHSLTEDDPEFNDSTIIFSLLDSHNQSFISFDFLDGNFYRISGTDSTGWSGDEVDLNKYC